MSAVIPEISSRNFEVTHEVRSLIESKLMQAEERFFDDVITVRVVLQVEKYRNLCEILIVGKDHDVKVTQESGQSMVDAVNAAIDHVRTQARKNRKKLRDHHKNDGTAPEKVLDEDRR